MSTFYYGPALDSELDHRRSTLLHDAAAHRLARQARLATRTGARTATRQAAVAQSGSPAAVPAPAEASAGPVGPTGHPAHPVSRAA
jgi:hypothetical protein